MFSTSTTFSATSTGVAASDASRSTASSRFSGRQQVQHLRRLFRRQMAHHERHRLHLLVPDQIEDLPRVHLRDRLHGTQRRRAWCVTRPITSLALNEPSAFSSVCRVTSAPAEIEVLAARATFENS